MKAGVGAIELIKKFEGCRLKAYQDSIGVWTIGYGNTYYEDGTKVKAGDAILMTRAVELLQFTLNRFAEKVDELVKIDISQNKFDALLSFSYNVGVVNLASSTLLKKVNINPTDYSIRDEFMKWNRAGGKVLPGLTKRRRLEADYYFK